MIIDYVCHARFFGLRKSKLSHKQYSAHSYLYIFSHFNSFMIVVLVVIG